MRRIAMLTGVLALAAAPALAGINPADAGLPAAWDITTTQGYGSQTAIAGNPASAMCVECHSVNPSPHVVAPSANGGYAVDNSTTHYGTHAVMNTLATGATDPWGVTNSGGGFLGGFGGAARDGGEYMNPNAWDTAGNTGEGVSKFEDAGAGALASVLATASPTWADADMICESCHNILVNEGAKLLLGTYGDNTDDTLCVGCHTNGGSTYAAFHANDNLPNFNNTARKRHHVLTGDTLSAANYDPDSNTATNNSIMWAPSFSDNLDPSWCGTPYAAITPAITLADGAGISFRNACNVSGVGTRSGSLAGGDIANVNATTINCANCHRPHNAMSTAGAFIFRTGDASDYPGQIGSSGTTVGTIGYGIRRQSDVGDWTATKVYGEYQHLCNGCHQGYNL